MQEKLSKKSHYSKTLMFMNLLEKIWHSLKKNKSQFSEKRREDSMKKLIMWRAIIITVKHIFSLTFNEYDYVFKKILRLIIF